MQISALVNILSSLQGAGAAASAQANAGAAAGQAPQGLGASNTNPSSLLQGSALTNAQFANLLGNNGTPTPGTAAQNSDSDQSTNNPTGDITQSPQTGNIAIPVIPTYIDQPIKNNVVLNKDTVADATSASKRKIFDTAIEKAKASMDSATTSKTLANEVGNSDNSPTTGATTAANSTQGAIQLANADTNTPVDDKAFSAAVSKILDQAKQKNALAEQADSRVTAGAGLNPASGTTATGKTAATATSVQGLTPAQQMAAKISAKVLDAKTDKIDDSDTDSTTQLSNNLQNFDTQLRSKDFTQIKAATDTLAQSPVDQVQVKISQGIASGLNNIKINLHPAELGSVDVDMDVDHQGNSKIRIVADRQDTLDMLKNNSHELTKSLSSAGVQADANSLQFSLRGDSQQQQFNNAQNNSGNTGQQQQQSNAVTATYSRYSSINEQDLMLSIPTNGLNILV